jgi:heat-inducible transcriptional repressor
MLINEYIAHALPIGSRTLIDRYHLDISSATVRNELSHLEDAGYLTSPHTSAGRVPTDFGYRAFVNDLLEHLPETPSPSMLEDLYADAEELDDLLDKTSQVLARFTNCLAMVAPSTLTNAAIMRITLVPLSTTRLLAMVVSEDGTIFKRTIEMTDEIEIERIGTIERALNELYAGSPLSKMPEHTTKGESAQALGSMNEALQDPLFLLIEQEIFDCCARNRAHRPHTLGISRLLDQPEFSDATRVSPLIEKLEDETILFSLFNETAEGDLPLVRIGHENDSDELSEISVATPYSKEGAQGMIAVIGPTRMNYEQVIKAVRAARTLLQDS